MFPLRFKVQWEHRASMTPKEENADKGLQVPWREAATYYLRWWPLCLSPVLLISHPWNRIRRGSLPQGSPEEETRQCVEMLLHRAWHVTSVTSPRDTPTGIREMLHKLAGLGLEEGGTGSRGRNVNFRLTQNILEINRGLKVHGVAGWWVRV